MQYFKIETGKFIEYDEATNRATIILKADLQTLKNDLETRIATADPNQPVTKDDWANWAKQNYPYVSHELEKIELERVDAALTAIKNL